MKYLLSVLFFLGFMFFSLPCLADVTNDDESFNFQDQTVDVVNRALLPEEVIQDASNQASLIPKTEIVISKDFFTEIKKSITNFGCSILQIVGLGGYCETSLSVGENTAQYTAKSKILGQSSIPTNMELAPAPKDPNLDDFNQKDVTGNKNLNQLSENLGTTTGFFKNDQPPLSDYDKCVQDRMKDKNFNLNGEFFKQDQRSADIYCSKQVFCQGNYPEVDGKSICPFEPPTP